MRPLITFAVLALGLPAGAAAPAPTAGQAYEAQLASDPATLEARAAVSARLAGSALSPDAASRVAALADGIRLAQLPPPPGSGGSLPPPPGSGSPLPPPPGSGDTLPPPPAYEPLPRPMYPGGPLPRGDHRLENAQRSYDESGDYIGFWDGSRGYTEDTGVVNTEPSDGGRYVLTLESREYRDRTHFVRKDDGAVYYYPERRLGRGESRRVVIDFVNRAEKPLLPWERERFVFSFQGDRSRNSGLELQSQNGAYRYGYHVSSDLRDPLTVRVEMEAGEKLLTSPDSEGVTLSLRPDGRGGLELVVTDLRASHYGGEQLQLEFEVRKVKRGFLARDTLVFGASRRAPRNVNIGHGVRDGSQVRIPVPASGPGEYYIENWAFRRANSRVSTGVWVGKRRGPRVSL